MFFKKEQQKAFTMIELTVVVGIFVMITGILLANYSKFSSSVVLENVAYSTGLSIRQAQTYGMVVKEFIAGSGDFPAYGTYFYTGGSGDIEFYIFADQDGNKRYDDVGCTPGSGECFDKLILQDSYYIYAICGNLKKDAVASGVFRTTDDVTGTPGIENYCGDIDDISIAFTRPNPDALITLDKGGAYSTADDAEIIVASPRGDVRTVVVWRTGQISIE
ncbi:Tfp pilus assembly protein FimT/FimU [Patescibacteria group bacterium]